MFPQIKKRLKAYFLTGLVVLLPAVVSIEVFIWLLTPWFNVFHTRLWPLLGFIFMPYTTLAYMGAMLSAGAITPLWLVLIVIAAIVDIGHWGGGNYYRRRRVIVVRR